ncbi:MAG: BatD family protein [Candidatus Zixiibacteriota bacterium]
MIRALLLVATVAMGILLGPAANSASAQDIEALLEVDRSSVTLDESVTLTVTISGVNERLPQPNVDKLGEFDVLSQGSSMKYSNINGVTETSTTFTLILTPRKIGTFDLGPATITINGQPYTSNSTTVTVTDGAGTAGAQRKSRKKDVFLEATVDNASPYVGEQILLSVRFYHAKTLLSQPSYTPPQTTDFWSDLITPQRSYYSTIEGRRYRALEINTALFPTRSGDLSIGRAQLETQVESGRRKQPFGFGSLFNRGETVNVRTRPIDLKVKPLPEAGKPSDFTGAVGRFTISASADQLSVEVNTPVTVSFRISGSGNIKVLPKPKIPDLREFRVYSGASDEQITKNKGRLGGVKTFEEVFIPKREGELVIPEVSYNFFDPQKGKYVTISSRQITLSVTSSAQQLAEPGLFSFPAGERVGAGMSSIRYIKRKPSGFRQKGSLLIYDRVYLLASFLPLLAVAGALFYRRHRDRLEGDVGYARARSASRVARKRLKRARELATVPSAEEFFAELRLAILALVADKLNISHHGLTIDQFSQTARRAGFDRASVELWTKLIQRADFVRYSPGSISEREIADSLVLAEDIIVKLQEATLD